MIMKLASCWESISDRLAARMLVAMAKGKTTEGKLKEENSNNNNKNRNRDDSSHGF